MPAPIGRLLQGRGKHGFFEILQRRAMMLAPARLALCAVQGTVEVAKLMVQRDDACTCKTRGAPRTEQRVTLRFLGRLPVPGAVVASGACNQSHAQGALVFGGAPRTEQRVTLPLHGRVIGKRAQCKALSLWPISAGQRDDACTCKNGMTARRNAPWRWPNITGQCDGAFTCKAGTTAR